MDPREYLNDNEEASRLMLDGRQAGVWTAMPAIVQSVNFEAMTCVCQIAIQGRTEDQNGNIQFQNISLIQDVPICFPSAGGFTITMPIAARSEVLLVFASRCIDSWWQNGGYENIPMEFRMHDLSDGFCIPGPKSQPNVIANISSTDCQIRNDAGTSYISITASGAINLVSSEGIAITGNLTVTGEVTAKSGTTNIPLSTHLHTGVQSGGSDTGGPIP
jgi:hypothetical protein